MNKIIKGKNDVSIAVKDMGSGSPVVFLHGWPLNNLMFEYQYNHLLENGYRVIGIDLRGYGESDLGVEDYGYDTFADDVKAVIEELNVTDATLVGFSMGGAAAVRYMARHNGFGVKKLVLLGAAAPRFTQGPDYPYGMEKSGVDELIEQAKVDRPKMVTDFGSQLFNKKPSDAYADWVATLAFKASSYGTILSAIALRDEDLSEDLTKVTVSTLIGHGKEDQVCPYDFAELMDKAIPDSTLKTFEESGHGIFHDQPDDLNNALLDFIQS
ncbi:alpha/beta fold hydrolase [Marinilactibacillus sp. Marseille-P9653]|uniref:alpha/beta fold hydrolase n=1 Tax=Marinilactibacillus sp. Marseille-P9653 TaxID=2866583 RepID=UPI001CE3BBD6|nr:alpha/beta hydrolase [Marinilactibacillus sp. Marseille-P9653]